MATLTPDQFEHFIRVMILVALLGGLVGAVIWDLIQASGLGMVSGIGYLVDRHKRIKAARQRAADSFFAPAPVAQSSLVCRGKYSEHDLDETGACRQCGRESA